MTSDDTKLLTCPWCNKNPNSGCNYGIGGAYVNCVNRECLCNPEIFIAANHNPDASLSLNDALIQAKTAWNTRTPSADYAVIARLEWQPIETAPKTTRIQDAILLYSEGFDRIQTDRWPQVQKSKRTTMDGVFHAPTHWMPLPNPPQALAPGGEK